MASYGPEPESPGTSRQVTLAAGVMVLALAIPYMSDGFHQQVAVALQSTALAPFIALQERLTEGRARADQIEFLQAELDSLASVASTQVALLDENRALRELLGMAERAGPHFLPATVLRPGTAGSESMFLVNVGAADGVAEGAPVVNARGLVGRITVVRQGSAVGMDWTHPDFRASAMLADGSIYGLVENVRQRFREEDRLMLNGTAYHESAPPGSLVVTSGLGVLPRGIRVGRIDATAEVQGSWRKSYWLRPLVDPASVTHALVLTSGSGGDVSALWPPDTVPLPADITPVPAQRTPPARATPTERTAPAEGAAAPRVAPPQSPPAPDTARLLDSVPTVRDSVVAPSDSVVAPADSVVAPPDSAPDSAAALPDSTAPLVDSVAPPPAVAPADSTAAPATGPPGA